ncbi:VWA domain-containing protein [uncultured Vibrio sp.]|uniref:vWA domain-containing protein n=1 Tax=uncultured Vibrio sp. TaxID=114054 RepID=UPI0025CC51F9|nr:VWA domain-containing protein [uncultured Vibrio sp.]
MSNFTFLYPLWLLALLPAIALIVWLSKQTQHASLVAPHLAKAIGLESKQHKQGLTALIGISLVIAVIALAGPSFYSSERPAYGNNSGRVVVMDMSFSMYATDIKPNRLTQARYKVTDLLNTWQEGNTGLVAYAGDAYTVSPMTTDNQTLLNLLPNLSPDIMPYPGADAAAGIKLAIEMMQNSGLDQGHIILVADDIDNAEKTAINQLLNNTQWKLSILAVATPSGAPIRLTDGTLLRDNSGTTVIAQSDFSNMKSLARQQDGLFTGVQANSKDIELIAAYTTQVDADTASSQQQKLEERVNSGFWLLPLLLIPASLLFRRGVLFSLFALSFAFFHPNQAHASPWQTNDQQAKAMFDSQEYQKAAETFDDREWQGAAHYQAGNYQGAIESLTGLEGERALYNLANAQAQNGDFEQAIENYNQLIEQGQFVKEAIENIEIVKQAQQQQQQENGDDNSSDSSDSSEPSESDSSGDSEQGDQNDQNRDPSNSNSQQDSEHQSESSSSEDADANAGNDNTPDTAQDEESQSSKRDNTQTEHSEEKTNPADREKSESTNHEEAGNDIDAAASQDNQQQIDPDIRKLEQVENARDPSRLLQAQMLLQAKQKQPPQNTGKKW